MKKKLVRKTKEFPICNDVNFSGRRVAGVCQIDKKKWWRYLVGSRVSKKFYKRKIFRFVKFPIFFSNHCRDFIFINYSESFESRTMIKTINSEQNLFKGFDCTSSFQISIQFFFVYFKEYDVDNKNWKLHRKKWEGICQEDSTWNFQKRVNFNFVY